MLNAGWVPGGIFSGFLTEFIVAVSGVFAGGLSVWLKLEPNLLLGDACWVLPRLRHNTKPVLVHGIGNLCV